MIYAKDYFNLNVMAMKGGKVIVFSILIILLILIGGTACKKESQSIGSSSSGNSDGGADGSDSGGSSDSGSSTKETPVPTMPTLPAGTAKAVTSGKGSNPSQHLVFQFPSDGILKMITIGIVQSGYSEYFSTINFNGGYCGLQQTTDTRWGSPYVIISSLWNNSGQTDATVTYTGKGIDNNSFGGEGTGAQTVGAYPWKVNQWYRMVVRSWKANNRINMGTYVQDMSTGIWTLMSIYGRNASVGFLGNGIDAFLENWVSDQGPTPKAAYFKDAWSLNTNGVWESPNNSSFSANSNDAGRNLDFDKAFNAEYNEQVDGYLSEHGGTVRPNAAFNGTRSVNLPLQKRQGTSPSSIYPTNVKSYSASYQNNSVNVKWEIDPKSSPMLSYSAQLLDDSNDVLKTVSAVSPQLNEANISTSDTKLISGKKYTVKVIITDIFNNNSEPITPSFVAQ